MASALLFDVDGTLVTFHFDVLGTRKALIEELSRRGFDTAGIGLTTPTQWIIDSATAQSNSVKGRSGLGDLKRAAYNILDSFEAHGAESARPFPETKSTLELLKNRGVRLAVLTNSGRKAASIVLERAGILEYFEFVLTRDDTATMKPRPEGLRQALGRLGLTSEEVYYVGDSPLDIAAAKSAGLRVISVATGNHDGEKLRSEGADFVLSSISEIPSVLWA